MITISLFAVCFLVYILLIPECYWQKTSFDHAKNLVRPRGQSSKSPQALGKLIAAIQIQLRDLSWDRSSSSSHSITIRKHAPFHRLCPYRLPYSYPCPRRPVLSLYRLQHGSFFQARRSHKSGSFSPRFQMSQFLLLGRQQSSLLPQKD